MRTTIPTVRVAEITMRNLMGGQDTGTPDIRDFLSRAEVLSASGLNVLVSDYSEFYRLAGYLRRQTVKPIALAMGSVSLPDIFDPNFYKDLDGGLLESLGRLFRGDLTLFVYPYLNRKTGELISVENLELPPDRKPLYDFLVRAGRIVVPTNHNPEFLSIDSRAVLKMIAAGENAWEKMVPEPVVQLIRERRLFNCKW